MPGPSGLCIRMPVPLEAEEGLDHVLPRFGGCLIATRPPVRDLAHSARRAIAGLDDGRLRCWRKCVAARRRLPGAVLPRRGSPGTCSYAEFGMGNS